MKNPLSRRLLRELRQDIGKYIALFLFLMLTTGFISGFLVADGSMVRAYDESFEKYDIESGHFILEDKLPDETKAKLEAAGVSVHELFYKEATLDNENTVRIFKNRSEVNKTDVLEGRLPENKGEIAADRLYLENNGLAIGDELAGLNVSRAALNAGKAGKALPKGLGIHKGLNVVIQHIGNELVRLNVHFVERRAGCGTFAALHALVGVDAADLADLLRLFADAHFNASSFTPRASARSSVK